MMGVVHSNGQLVSDFGRTRFLPLAGANVRDYRKTRPTGGATARVLNKAVMHQPPLLDSSEQAQLLHVAAQSVLHGLRFGDPLRVELNVLPARLTEPGACFVTLHDGDELRGCVGTLEPHHPLAQQVANSAYDSAFRDLRLPPVDESELERLTVDVSVLSPLTDLIALTERDLLGQLRPGIDGIVVGEGERQATFLPKVWEAFDLPFDFIEHLKRKAGLPPRYWSPTLRWRRYTVLAFGSSFADLVAVSS
jgi:AmmeMemoRadiSam system protein A